MRAGEEGDIGSNEGAGADRDGTGVDDGAVPVELDVRTELDVRAVAVW